MKFGNFCEHQLPRPWTERGECGLFQSSLVEVEVATIPGEVRGPPLSVHRSGGSSAFELADVGGQQRESDHDRR